MKKRFLIIPLLFSLFISACNSAFQPIDDDSGKKDDDIIEPVVEETHDLEITSFPKVDYNEGDRFSISGLLVIDKQTKTTIPASNLTFTIGTTTIKHNDVIPSTGTIAVTISLEKYNSVSFNINVTPKPALKIVHAADKTTFKQGEEFTSSGLIVNDQMGQRVTDFNISIAEGSVLKYTGTFDVTISKTGFPSTSYKITVIEGESQVTGSRELKIYYINDTHGSFIRDNDNREAGMAYIGKYLKDKKAEDPDNTLILSGGDMFQGGAESNLTYGAIMVDAMNEIGFDAMVVGNHEFDWGEEAVASLSEQANFPFLSSNIFYAGGNERPDWLTPYTIINKGDLKIGIIGAAVKNMGSSITGSISDDFRFPDPVSYVSSLSHTLRLTYNCDLVLSLHHDEGFEGYNDNDKPTKFADLVATDSSTNLPYVDGIFFAHDHYRKQGKYYGVPYLEAQCNGKYIGEMTFSLEKTASYHITSSSTDSYSAYTTCTTSDATIANLTTKYSSQIGDLSEVLYTFSNSYTTTQFTVVMCQAMLWYVNSHPSYFNNTTVYLATHNTGGIRSSVSAGDFTMRDLIKVCPFDNALYIQTANSTQVSNSKNSSYYAYYQPGTIQYNGGYTKVVTISYIAEYKYASNYQTSAIKYGNYSAKQCLIEYLRGNVNQDL